MATFQYIINALWLLAILPVIAVFLLHKKWKQKAIKTLGDARLVSLMMVGVSERRVILKTVLIVSSLVCLGLAMMNYQKLSQEAGGGMRGLDVMIALDVSNSMLATDVPPNRLERARLLASRLIDTLQGNRVGIIAFAGDAYLQLPLTTDLTAARLFLQSVSTSMVPRQGTNIHDALALANQSMDPAEHDYKAVVLITDGEELDDKALDVAKELRAAGIVILPVGIGTPLGATLPGDDGEQRRDDDGKIVVSKLNEEVLQRLAEETTGTYQTMGETEITVQALASEIFSLDKKPIANAGLVNYQSYSPWLILIALILLITEWLLPERKLNVNRKDKLQNASMAMKTAVPLLIFLFSTIYSQAQSTEALLQKANEAYRQKQYDQAEKLYQDVLKTDPANKIAKYNLGNIAYRRKEYEAAVQNYEQVTAEKNASSKAEGSAWNNKGLSYVQQKDIAKAIESFKESLRENPYDEETRNNLYKALREQQQQQQKPNPDSNKQNQNQPPPPPKQQPQNKMKQNDAEQKLQALRQEEKKIRDKMKQQASGEPTEKDW